MISRALLILGLFAGVGSTASQAQETPPATAPAVPAATTPAAPVPAPSNSSTVVVAEPIAGVEAAELKVMPLPEIIAPAPKAPTSIGAVTAGQTFEERTAILMNNFHSVLATAKTADQISSLSNQVQAELTALAIVQNQRIIEQNARIIELLERQAKSPAPASGG